MQYFLQAGLFFAVPLFLSVALGLSAIATGVRLLPLSITLLLAAAGVPRVFPHASPRRVVQVGFLALFAGIVVMVAALDEGAGPEIVTWPMLLAGLGIGALASQLGSVTVSAVPDEQSGEVGGIQNTVTNLGASIGTALSGVEAGPDGIGVDEHLRAGERLWAIGGVNSIWPLTHVGEYEGDLVAANIAGDGRPANYEAVPRVTYTDPQAAAVGAAEAEYSASAQVSEVPKPATYTHAYAESNGFLTLLSDGERLTGAYALGPEAGEWMQQATLAIRAHVPLEVLSDTIQPFPSFSGIYDAALAALRMAIADMPRPASPMDAQMASLPG